MISVMVEMTEFPNVIRMTWSHLVNADEVQPAFEMITSYLDNTEKPMYVVVDILADPLFPLRETISSALWTAYKHPMLAKWLVIGTNPLAHAIERTLSRVTGRYNVLWFKSETEVRQYLKAQVVTNAS